MNFLKQKTFLKHIRESTQPDMLVLLPPETQKNILAQIEKEVSNSGLPAAWFEIAQSYLLLHDFESAIRCYEHAITDPKFKQIGDALNNLGSALQQTGKYREAIAYHKKALDCPSFRTPAKAWFNMGNCFTFGLEEHTEAIACYENIIRQFPEYERIQDVWGNMGRCYSLLGNKMKSEECYSKQLGL